MDSSLRIDSIIRYSNGNRLRVPVVTKAMGHVFLRHHRDSTGKYVGPNGLAL
jgi:hypothetical protein